MKLEDIYESFFDTYRNMGYMISELSQRLLRRASAVAGAGAGDRDDKPSKNYRDETAKKLNREKLDRQSSKFFLAAAKKAGDSERGESTGGSFTTSSQHADKVSRKTRARIVNKDLIATDGFESAKERSRAMKKGRKDAKDVKRLRKRFKGELDG